ncbi:MAG: hypothetical protein M1445_13980 [Bacteroidetes bacterium]|nr:hypothetical protein [Bacteroidota bacterium]
MTVHDICSKRHRKQIDVFSYENLSEKLKIQIEFIWRNFFNGVEESYSKEIWKVIHRILCEEHGKRLLFNDKYGTEYLDSYRVLRYFQDTDTIDENLDVIEIVFKYIERTPEILNNSGLNFRGNYNPQQAIKDLNTRFLENGVGFEYQDGNIIRIDNKLLHKEVIIETLHFLTSNTFKNANEEFLSAHEHYRHKRNKECLNDCLKALETTMKVICQLNNWEFSETDAAKKLLDTCIKNGLIPTFLMSHFTSLRTSLESGVPTIRNKLGGHGQGTTKITVPAHFASYMLYLTGTTINFLVSCQQEIKLLD